MSNLIERIKKAAQRLSNPDTPCIHRGVTKRREKKSCCGVVEIFDCPALGHAVWDNKCKTCDSYEARQAPRPKALLMSWGVPVRLEAMGAALAGCGFGTETVKRGKPAAAKLAINYIKKEKPRFIVWWQRPYGKAAQEIMSACRRWSVQPIVTDHGCWPHYNSVIFDAQGENAGADIVGRFDALAAVEAAQIEASLPAVDQWEATIRDAAGKAALRRTELGLDKTPPVFVLATLQRRDKVLDLDAPKSVRRHDDLARELIAAATAASTFVVIKPHPQSDPLDIPERGPHHWIVPKQPFGQKNTQILSWLLVNATHLVTVNSTTWMTAVVVGKPVAVLGDGWYTGNRILHRVSTPDLALNVPPMDRERAKRFLTFMVSRQLLKDHIADPAAFSAMVDRLYPGWSNGASHREQRRFGIIGCGRSGTKYTAALMQACGLDVGHEQVLADGACGWTLAADRVYTNHLGHTAHRPEYLFDHMLHQVRNPVDAIASMTTHTKQFWEFAHREMGLRPERDRVKRALRFWVVWNLRCAAMADWTYRVEDLRPGTDTWLQFRGIAGLECSCPDLPKNINARNHGKLTAKDLRRRYPAWGARMAKMAEEYGYDL